MPQINQLMAHDFMPNKDDLLYGSGDNKEKVLRIIKSKSDGVGTTDIANSLELAKNTVLKILRELDAEREIYFKKIGGVTVWYPNGRLVHPYLELYKELRGTPYRVTVQEGRNAPVIQIQERSYSLLTGETVEGAIFVEYRMLNEFIEGLEEIRERFEIHSNNTEVSK